MMEIEIRPGQIWIDVNGRWGDKCDYYIIKSKEPDEPWELIQFPLGVMGGKVRPGFKDDEIRKMAYIGDIIDAFTCIPKTINI